MQLSSLLTLIWTNVLRYHEDLNYGRYMLFFIFYTSYFLINVAILVMYNLLVFFVFQLMRYCSSGTNNSVID